LFVYNLKGGGSDQTDQLVEVVPPHKTPSGLGYKGLEQGFDRHEAIVREHQAKFIGPMAKDVSEHPGQAFELPRQTGHKLFWFLSYSGPPWPMMNL
jgi:hypothetical protein